VTFELRLIALEGSAFTEGALDQIGALRERGLISTP
jgi:hypothetical protein